MTRFVVIVLAGLAIAYAISLLPVEQINSVGSVWGATFKVFAYGALAAMLVGILTTKRR